ncbi:hypothetical protein QR680_006052 [Steinernema hermaphroditum]|uniref:Nuclear receptor domain-containing protein n=1 Tax=Steinernema hermaphroditum TaxID=289476 RepID=A0AA39HWC7_9BILA|nr:hypothetical protein QR680_006052 [Steinernema hermaphroditum]
MSSWCVVCGSRAHGVHFQVPSCRACAAFFRRSISIGKHYKCRRATQNCDLNSTATNICRYCRYQKCIQVGMVLTVHVVNPMNLNGDRRVPVIQPNPGYTGGEGSSEEASPHMVYQDNKLIYDPEPLIEQLRKVLTTPIPYISSLSTMRSLLLTFQNFWPNKETLTVTEVSTLDYRVFLQNIEKEILRCAQFAMSCRQFAQLPIEEKWFMIQPFWSYYHHVSRIHRTIDTFGRGQFLRYMITDTICVKMGFKFEIPIEDKKHDLLHEIYGQSASVMKESLIDPMVALNLTDFEVVYMLAMGLFNTRRNKRLSNMTKTMSEQVIEEISDELHHHYLDEMRIDNYAARLAKIVKLQVEYTDLRRYFKDVITMIEFFDIFSNSFAKSPFCSDL